MLVINAKLSHSNVPDGKLCYGCINLDLQLIEIADSNKKHFTIQPTCTFFNCELHTNINIIDIEKCKDCIKCGV